MKCRIAIIGGGASGMFLYKRLLETGRTHFTVDIFERSHQLGSGMPYSTEGADMEHVTNVSGNEIPLLVIPLTEWVKSLPAEELELFGLRREQMHDFKVLPRLLFGKYLAAQFYLLLKEGFLAGIGTRVHRGCTVTDIIPHPGNKGFTLEVDGQKIPNFDYVIIATGHHWPREKEGTVPNYFDSPYPPAKLKDQVNRRIAIKGSSLTAIDAIRTLARRNGLFITDELGQMSYRCATGADKFQVTMHSRHGMLPGIRFHLEDPHLSKSSLLSRSELQRHRIANDGFIDLDFIFEKDFKDQLKVKDPAFYELIKSMSLEEFVEAMMSRGKNESSFTFFKKEYASAAKSIKRQESILWKELLAVLSFAMNYPAKYFSAEDMLRLQRVLMPLISVVIAFAPQRSCEELIALHEAGRLEIFTVDSESRVEVDPQKGIIYHRTGSNGERIAVSFDSYLDCTGQPHLSLESFPYRSLKDNGNVTAARLKFRSQECAKVVFKDGSATVDVVENGSFYLRVPGIAINDDFQAIDREGLENPNLYIMAVPFIGGFNPDYSGLDFCEEASKRIVESMFESLSGSPRASANSNTEPVPEINTHNRR